MMHSFGMILGFVPVAMTYPTALDHSSPFTPITNAEARAIAAGFSGDSLEKRGQPGGVCP